MAMKLGLPLFGKQKTKITKTLVGRDTTWAETQAELLIPEMLRYSATKEHSKAKAQLLLLLSWEHLFLFFFLS